MQKTSALATACAEISVPVSLRQVITGDTTSATRQCFACSSSGSTALGQMLTMLWDVKRDPMSGKRKSKVMRDVIMISEISYA